MCIRDSLIDGYKLEKLGGHFIINSSHILSLWSDWFNSLWRPFSPHTYRAQVWNLWICLGYFCSSVDQCWPWSTLGFLTSNLFRKSDFRRPYSWALKLRNSGFFDGSATLLSWLFCCCMRWLFCAVLDLTCIDLWWAVFEGCGCDTWSAGWPRKTLLVEASCWPP